MIQDHYYHDSILGNDAESFINLFQHSWRDHLTTFPKKYQQSKQLIMGSRFRPLLVCWGYALSGNKFLIEHKKRVVNLALHIELLHKATLLIDDLIDNDSSRHGEISFHIEFSESEAIIFAIFLVGDALEKLSETLESNVQQEYSFEIIKLLSETIKEMTIGAIHELNLNSKQITSLHTIRKIIELQTVSIIKNGLLTGFKFGGGDKSLFGSVDNIGYDCGYIFQILNDLEPFGDSALNSSHKGAINIDIIHSRKNIVVAFIYNKLNRREKQTFQTLFEQEDKTEILELLQQWYLKYNIKESILDNLSLVVLNIKRNIKTLLVELDNEILIDDFLLFLDFIIKEAVKKVGESHFNKLSDILKT